MISNLDGPTSPHFTPVDFNGNATFSDLPTAGISREMSEALEQAPRGACVGWGVPFTIKDLILIQNQVVEVGIQPTTARWFIFMHTSDRPPRESNPDGFISPMRGEGRLGELAATYTLRYADGTEASALIRRRFQIGAVARVWGENCFEAVAQHKPQPRRGAQEQLQSDWGESQTRADASDHAAWQNWLWAWENPHPGKAVTGFCFTPGSGLVILSAISTGSVTDHPFRWQSRQKGCLSLPITDPFQPDLDADGLLRQIRLDLGQVISASRRLVYPNDTWEKTYHNQLPHLSTTDVLVEYTTHAQACFHLTGGKIIPAAEVAAGNIHGVLQQVPSSRQDVKLRVLDRATHQVVAVKLHVHGEWGEYLTPIDRHRILNPAWFEDFSVDFRTSSWNEWDRSHSCTYINGETTLKLPQGKVYLEITKGFEIRPLRQVVEITPTTTEIIIEIERILPWREKGWVTADTHVHFLSPISALLEGAAEGVNIINLLASQWGELMTNVGDFDGKTTWGSREAGGEGEYLVRVGTENRQHVMGHISLLGYHAPIIAPMTTGGADESAIGDPIEVLLTEWARQCRSQGGVVVLPHFPNPRAEHAASIVSGDIDAVEMTSWGDLHSGIDPYSLSDWYRYLNCGYFIAAVGGTDKMSANTAVGTVRTYAHLSGLVDFSYENWKETVRRGETFVTYGPLLEFAVDGHSMGSRIHMTANGGTLDVTWQVASVALPVTRVELVVNGEIRETAALSAAGGSGSWSVKVGKSCWLAILVRGHQPDKPEIIAAHSSPVMVQIADSPMLAAADAVTILEQIEGALVYLDTVGTRAEDRVYKRMRLVLEASHRSLHNRMHQQGNFHDHTPLTDHPQHH